MAQKNWRIMTLERQMDRGGGWVVGECSSLVHHALHTPNAHIKTPRPGGKTESEPPPTNVDVDMRPRPEVGHVHEVLLGGIWGILDIINHGS